MFFAPRILYLCEKTKIEMKLSFLTRTSAKKLKQQTVPIYVRLRDDAVDIWQRTPLTVVPEYWDPKTEDLKARIVIPNKEREEFSDQLHDLKKYIRQCYDRDVVKNKICKQWLITILADYSKRKNTPPPKEKSIRFETLFTQFMSDRIVGDNRTRQYNVIKRAIMRFELYKQKTSQKGFRFNVKTMTEDHMRELWNFLRDEHEIKKDYPELYTEVPGCQKVVSQRSNNTLVGFIKRLKVFFNWCKSEGIIKESPLAGFDMPTEKYGTPIYINKEEMHAIFNHDFSAEPHLERQRDIFIFQCCTACRVGDLIRLTKADIINDALEYIPSKTIEETQDTIVVPLNKMAKHIVEKYKDLEGNQLLPFISPQKYNEAIKVIFKKAGVTRNVTWLNPLTEKEEKRPINEIASSHMARRAFIGNTFKQVRDQSIVASMSGHSEGSRAFSRYREIDRDIKTDVVNALD